MGTVIGAVYGRLIIVDELPRSNGHRIVICNCVCGKRKETRLSRLVTGATASCGCLMANHGESHTRLYKIWINMLYRCNDSTCHAYADYGGRGIKVCPAWADFPKFRDWATTTGYTPSLTIDRKNNDGNYEPSNCRWATHSTQASNKRKLSGTQSQYIGVFPIAGKWRAVVQYKKKPVIIGFFDTELEAAQQRDAYILANGLPHKLNF